MVIKKWQYIFRLDKKRALLYLRYGIPDFYYHQYPFEYLIEFLFT